MKLSEIVLQLQLLLPKFTDLFSNTLDVNTISVSSNIASINTNINHNLSNGDAVTVSDISQNNLIDSVSKDGLIFTFTTVNDHDLTLGFLGYETVKLGGFTDSFWNDDFKLIGVINRKTFTIQSINPIPILNTNEFLTEIRVDGINGRFSTTVIDTTNFTIAGNFNDGVYIDGTIKTAARIAGSVTIERAIEQYTKQDTNDLWLIVTMTGAETSKNRTAYNDAVATVTSGQDIRTRIIDGFSVFIIKNTTTEIAAVNAVDIARHDLLSPLMKSLFGSVFSSGLSGSGDFKSILRSHNFVDYNRATFVYQYLFEVIFDLTLEDAVDIQDTRAFLDLDYTHTINGDDTDDLTVGIEL